MKFQAALKTEVSFNSENILMVIIVDYSLEKVGKNESQYLNSFAWFIRY